MPKNSRNPLDEENRKSIIKMLEDEKTYTQISDCLNVSRHSVFKVANNMDSYDRGKLIQASGVSKKLHSDLENIARNLDMKLPQFIKMHLKKIAASYSEEMKKG